MRRGVRAGRRSSPAKRVYGLKPVSRVQISPSPPHTQVKRRVTVKGNSPFLRSERGGFGGHAGWRTYRQTYFWEICGEKSMDDYTVPECSPRGYFEPLECYHSKKVGSPPNSLRSKSNRKYSFFTGKASSGSFITF